MPELEILREAGVNIKALNEQPVVQIEDLFYWQAFIMLSACRPTGFSVGAIPFGDLLAYCDTFGIHSLAEKEDFIKIIQGLDYVFLTFADNKGGGK